MVKAVGNLLRRRLMKFCGESGLAVLLAGASIANGAEASSFTFDDSPSVSNWTFHNGPEYPGAAGRIDWLATEGHDKPGCLRLHHEFAKGGNYVQAISPDVSKSDIGAIRMWLKKPNAHRFGSGQSAVIAVCSSDAYRRLTVEHSGLARVLDMMGSPLDVDVTAGSLAIPLDAGFPVYLEGRPDMTFSAKASSMPLSPSRKHVHPGDTLEVRADAGVEVVDWRMPVGWPMPMRNAAGVYELRVPDVAVSGPVELIARLRGGLLPQISLRFSVEPRLLRL